MPRMPFQPRATPWHSGNSTWTTTFSATCIRVAWMLTNTNKYWFCGKKYIAIYYLDKIKLFSSLTIAGEDGGDGSVAMATTVRCALFEVIPAAPSNSIIVLSDLSAIKPVRYILKWAKRGAGRQTDTHTYFYVVIKKKLHLDTIWICGKAPRNGGARAQKNRALPSCDSGGGESCVMGNVWKCVNIIIDKL